MLTAVALLLALAWFIGLIVGVTEGAIHLLLIAALALLAYDVMLGRRRAHLR